MLSILEGMDGLEEIVKSIQLFALFVLLLLLTVTPTYNQTSTLESIRCGDDFFTSV